MSYVDEPPEVVHAGMLAAGLSPWLADALVELNGVYRTGAAAGTTDEVQKATGRAARSFDDFLTDHAAAFRSV